MGFTVTKWYVISVPANFITFYFLLSCSDATSNEQNDTKNFKS